MAHHQLTGKAFSRAVWLAFENARDTHSSVRLGGTAKDEDSVTAELAELAEVLVSTSHHSESGEHRARRRRRRHAAQPPLATALLASTGPPRDSGCEAARALKPDLDASTATPNETSPSQDLATGARAATAR